MLDTGLSTVAPVDRAIARIHARRRVHHLKIYAGPRFLRAVAELSEQTRGSHADEIETSIMLAISPHVVDIRLAQPSPTTMDGSVAGPLDPTDAASSNFSPSGSFGDPRLASKEKGNVLIEAILADLIDTLSSLE